MKKLILFLLMAPICAFAADQDEICRRNTLVMAVLQMSENGTVTSMNPSTMRWEVEFNYDLFGNMYAGVEKKKIKGRTTCNGINVKSMPDGSSSNGGTATYGDANTFLKAAPQDTGIYCWCKMDGPITSWWTYVKEYGNADDCITNCTNYCANSFANDTDMGNGRGLRQALFYSIW